MCGKTLVSRHARAMPCQTDRATLKLTRETLATCQKERSARIPPSCTGYDWNLTICLVQTERRALGGINHSRLRRVVLMARSVAKFTVSRLRNRACPTRVTNEAGGFGKQCSRGTRRNKTQKTSDWARSDPRSVRCNMKEAKENQNRGSVQWYVGQVCMYEVP